MTGGPGLKEPKQSKASETGSHERWLLIVQVHFRERMDGLEWMGWSPVGTRVEECYVELMCPFEFMC